MHTQDRVIVLLIKPCSCCRCGLLLKGLQLQLIYIEQSCIILLLWAVSQDEDVFNERMRTNDQDNSGIQNEAVVLKGLTKVSCSSTSCKLPLQLVQMMSLTGQYVVWPRECQ